MAGKLTPGGQGAVRSSAHTGAERGKAGPVAEDGHYGASR